MNIVKKGGGLLLLVILSLSNSVYGGEEEPGYTESWLKRRGILNNRIIFFRNNSNGDSLLHLSKTMQYEAGLVGDSLYVLKGMLNEGQAYRIWEQTANSLKVTMKALQLSKRLIPAQPIQVANCQMAVGQILLLKGDFLIAFERLHLAQRIYMKLKDEQGISNCYYLLGSGFGWARELDSTYSDSSFFYQWKSVGIRRHHGDSQAVLNSLNNMAIELNQLGRYERAADVLKHALNEVAPMVDSNEKYPYIRSNYGESLCMSGNHAEGRRMLFEAMKSALPTRDTFLLRQILSQLVLSYTNQEISDSAEIYSNIQSQMFSSETEIQKNAAFNELHLLIYREKEKQTTNAKIQAAKNRQLFYITLLLVIPLVLWIIFRQIKRKKELAKADQKRRELENALEIIHSRKVILESEKDALLREKEQIEQKRQETTENAKSSEESEKSEEITTQLLIIKEKEEEEAFDWYRLAVTFIEDKFKQVEYRRYFFMDAKEDDFRNHLKGQLSIDYLDLLVMKLYPVTRADQVAVDRLKNQIQKGQEFKEIKKDLDKTHAFRKCEMDIRQLTGSENRVNELNDLETFACYLIGLRFSMAEIPQILDSNTSLKHEMNNLGYTNGDHFMKTFTDKIRTKLDIASGSHPSARIREFFTILNYYYA